MKSSKSKVATKSLCFICVGYRHVSILLGPRGLDPITA